VYFYAGLPDGIFSNQKSQFGKVLEGLAMEDVSLFYANLAYFKAICYILKPFGILCGHFGLFSQVSICCTYKNLATPLL
jgi:hypothetical protein